MENERFHAYYKAQNIVPEDEWESFMNALRQHLPTTFRVAGSRQYVLSRLFKDVCLYIIYQQDSKLSQ
jgi:multisite-specific tRNA:(cytosine-C5)-methyltransferase